MGLDIAGREHVDLFKAATAPSCANDHNERWVGDLATVPEVRVSALGTGRARANVPQLVSAPFSDGEVAWTMRGSAATREQRRLFGCVVITPANENPADSANRPTKVTTARGQLADLRKSILHRPARRPRPWSPDGWPSTFDSALQLVRDRASRRAWSRARYRCRCPNSR